MLELITHVLRVCAVYTNARVATSIGIYHSNIPCEAYACGIPCS